MIGNISSQMATKEGRAGPSFFKQAETNLEDYVASDIYQEPDHEGESPFFCNNPEIQIEDFQNDRNETNDNGFDSFLSGSLTPNSKKLDNCLSNDLLKRLEEYSPIKPKKSTNYPGPSDFCLDTWEQNDVDSTPNKSTKLSSFASLKKKEGYTNSPLSEGNCQKVSKFSQDVNQILQFSNCNEYQDDFYQNKFNMNQNSQTKNNNYPGYYQGGSPLGQIPNLNSEEGFNFPSTIQNNTIITSAKNYIINNIPHNAINQVQSPSEVSGQNQVKSFMYGKLGWVCGACKNFNYEGKFSS